MQAGGGKFTLTLFGAFAIVEHPNGAPVAIGSTRRKAIVAYLASQPGGAETRERLATLLWGDSPDAQARQSLRQALLMLRREFGPAGEGLFVTDRHLVRIDLARLDDDAPRPDADVQNMTAGELDFLAAGGRGTFLADLRLDVAGFDEWAEAQRALCRRQEEAARAIVAERGSVRVTLSPEPEPVSSGTAETGVPAPIEFGPPRGDMPAEPGSDQPEPGSKAAENGVSAAMSPAERVPRWAAVALGGLAACNVALLAIVAGPFLLKHLNMLRGSTPDCLVDASRGATAPEGAHGWIYARPGATCRYVGYLVPHRHQKPDELRVGRQPIFGTAQVIDGDTVYVAGSATGTDVFTVEGGGRYNERYLPFRLTFTVAIRD